MVERGGTTLFDRHRTILGQGAWVAAGQGATGLLTLAGTRLITQFVSPELYGAVNLVQNVVLLLRSLFCSPMVNAALRFYPDAEHGGFVPALRRKLWRSLLRATLMTEVLVTAGGLVWCARTGMSPVVVGLLCVYVAADVFRTLEMSLFNAERRQRPAALLSAFETLLRPLLVVAGVLALGRTRGVIVAANAASILLTLAVLYATSVSRPAGDARLAAAVDAELLRYALPLVPIAALNWLTSVSDRYIIEWISHDLAGIGVYAAGYGLVSQPFMLIHGVVALTLRPVYFAAVARGDHARSRTTFRAWIALSTAVCTCATTAIFLLRSQLVRWLLGPPYHGAEVYLPWIALGYLFYVIEQVLEQPLLAHKRTSAVLLAQICGATASVAATIPLVMRFGTIGAAYACPAYFLIQLATAAILVSRPQPLPAVGGGRG